MDASIQSIAAVFATGGSIVDIDSIDRGHINDTWLVQTSLNRRFVLQRINHAVFRDPRGLMRNVLLVTRHLKESLEAAGQIEIERHVLQIVPHRDGDTYFETTSGQHWRMYHYIEDSHPVDDSPTPTEIYQAAFGLGQFAALLTDLPSGTLCETIPNFHHGPLRYAAFTKSVTEDIANRATNVRREIDFILQHEWLLSKPQQMLDSGVLQLRIAHNDAKSNNVLLDNRTNEALCVIDLDTVMPGLALYDFGDLVRTTATRAAEDERDLGNVRIEAVRLEAAANGFLAGSRNLFDPAERESLVIGPSYMALIMATRFLTDYLQGDVYYKVHRTDQNLDRCRAQLKLVQGLIERESDLATAFVSSTGG